MQLWIVIESRDNYLPNIIFRIVEQVTSKKDEVKWQFSVIATESAAVIAVSFVTNLIVLRVTNTGKYTIVIEEQTKFLESN